MTVITGSLTVTDPGVTIDKWRVAFLDTRWLGIEDEIEVTSNGSTPVDWSMNLNWATSAYFVVVTPKFDNWWDNNSVFDLGALIMPLDKAALFLYELTAITPVNNDPYWDEVVFRLNADASLIDEKGHTLSLEPNSTYRLDGQWYTPQDDSWAWMGKGAVQFNEYGFPGPLTIDHADLNLGTGNFTLELWVRDYYGSNRGTVFCYGTPGSGSELKLEGTRFQPMKLWLGATELFASTNFQGTTWEKWVFARQSGTLYVIRDGALVATLAVAGEINGPLHIGALPTEPKLTFTGQVFDVCITKGRARVTAGYTPWKLRSLGPQSPVTGSTEPDWPETQNATVTDGAYTWTAKHRVVQPLIEGPIWPVEANG